MSPLDEQTPSQSPSQMRTGSLRSLFAGCGCAGLPILAGLVFLAYVGSQLASTGNISNATVEAVRTGADTFWWFMSLLFWALLLGLGWLIRSKLSRHVWYRHLTVALVIAAVVVPPLVGRGLNWFAILVAIGLFVDAVLMVRRRSAPPSA